MTKTARYGKEIETTLAKAMSEQKPLLYVDMTSIPLPSDQITFGTQRKRHPELFSSDMGSVEGECIDMDVVAIYELERECARKAFAKVTGQALPEITNYDRRVLISMLNDAYKEYGLSTGMNATRELVRKIEQAAIDQARSRLGQSPAG